MKNKRPEKNPYESFFSDIREINIDNFLPRRKNRSLHLSQRTGSNSVIESVRVSGIDPAAIPIIVWEDPKNLGFFEILDGDLRLKGVKANGRIHKVYCIVITAKIYSEALKIANNFNDHIHSIRANLPPVQTVFSILFEYFKDRAITKNLRITSELKALIRAKLGISQTTLHRMLCVIRNAIRKHLQPDQDFFRKDATNAFFDLIKSEKCVPLKKIYDSGNVFTGYKEILPPKPDKIKNETKNICPDCGAAMENTPKKVDGKELFSIDFNGYKYVADIYALELPALESFIKSCPDITAVRQTITNFVKTLNKIEKDNKKIKDQTSESSKNAKATKPRNPNQYGLFEEVTNAD